MLTSFGLILLAGIAAAAICKKVKVPGIIGMLITGIIIGPYALNILDPVMLSISSELRRMALIIILLKAGLTLDLSDLKKVGRSAVMMAFVPASFEIIAYMIFAPMILHVSLIEAAVLGAVLSAVSPAVVVPRMVQMIESKQGTQKSIPQMILAGASCDDVYVIVLFSTFVNMAQGGSADIKDFINIPVSIVLGVLLGALTGWCLSQFFEYCFNKGSYVRNTTKMIIVLGVSFMLSSVESMLEPYVAVSGLLAVMSMGCMLKYKCPEMVAGRLAQKFGKLWIAAEALLFVLVGAAVDIRYTMAAGAGAILMIFVALIIRAVGVVLCVAGTKLNMRERVFCVISYLPKATVQAAIGSVPLALGLPCGKLVLSVAVLAILITAPLGAFGMDLTKEKLVGKAEGNLEG